MMNQNDGIKMMPKWWHQNDGIKMMPSFIISPSNIRPILDLKEFPADPRQSPSKPPLKEFLRDLVLTSPIRQNVVLLTVSQLFDLQLLNEGFRMMPSFWCHHFDAIILPSFWCHHFDAIILMPSFWCHHFDEWCHHFDAIILMGEPGRAVPHWELRASEFGCFPLVL